MEEDTLIKALIVVGLISLGVMSVSGFLVKTTTAKFLSQFIPLVLCRKDYSGEYILGQPTSYAVCDMVNDISDTIETPGICGGFKNEKRHACLGLVEIANQRKSDCIALLFGRDETSVNPEDVKNYCEILNATLSD